MRVLSRLVPILTGAIGMMLAMSGTAGAYEVVKIGFAAPLTGALAQFGKETEYGARMAVAELNANPVTVNGKPVRLVLDSQDDAGDPRAATQVAQRLVDEGVVAVVGHMTSGTSVPASRLYHNAGIAQVSPGATSPVYTRQAFATTFRLVATDVAQGAALAEYAAHKLRVRTVVLVDDQSEYGESLASSFEHAARGNGIDITRRDAISAYGMDFRALLTILKTLNPDAILFSGFVNAGVPFIRQARQLNVRSVILGGDGLCSETLVRLAGNSADGVVCSTPGSDFRTSQRGCSVRSELPGPLRSGANWLRAVCIRRSLCNRGCDGACEFNACGRHPAEIANDNIGRRHGPHRVRSIRRLAEACDQHLPLRKRQTRHHVCRERGELTAMRRFPSAVRLGNLVLQSIAAGTRTNDRALTFATALGFRNLLKIPGCNPPRGLLHLPHNRR